MFFTIIKWATLSNDARGIYHTDLYLHPNQLCETMKFLWQFLDIIFVQIST